MRRLWHFVCCLGTWLKDLFDSMNEPIPIVVEYLFHDPVDDSDYYIRGDGVVFSVEIPDADGWVLAEFLPDEFWQRNLDSFKAAWEDYRIEVIQRMAMTSMDPNFST